MSFHPNTSLKQIVIICGFGHIGKSVLDLLKQFHFDIYVVTITPIDPDFMNEHSKNVKFILGDARNDETLKKACVQDAFAIFADIRAARCEPVDAGRAVGLILG